MKDKNKLSNYWITHVKIDLNAMNSVGKMNPIMRDENGLFEE